MSDDFNPATMDDDTIYIGTRKYVAADRIEELEANLAKAVGIAKRRGKHVPIGTVECRGDKCRQPWCISCCGEEDAEMAIYKILSQYSDDYATLAELEVKP
jgi:hypothetical protein